MHRRGFLLTAAAAAVPSIAGCSALGDDNRGRTYRLSLAEPDETSSERVLDYDTAGLTLGQQEIVDEAVRTGSYSEANVSWSTQPGQENVTVEFRMVIQSIARHVDRDPEITEETSFETPSQYEGRRYRSIVEVESGAGTEA